MPWPCTLQYVLRGVNIAVCYVSAERTHVSTHTESFLHDLSTHVTFLRRETRIDSYHSMMSSLSLIFKNSEKRAPASIHDGLREVMIFDHIVDTQVLDNNAIMIGSILV